MVIANKRSIITLYSGSQDALSHQIRIVLEEKGVAFEVTDIDRSTKAKEEVAECNPYGSVPTLIDRDLVLYKPEIITEYIDERFPHPPLLPVYPILKARSRLMIYRISNDWYTLMDKILSPEVLEMNKQKFRQELKDSLLSASPIFAESVYFLGEEFSLIDCWLAPLLWRLPAMGIDITTESKSIVNYQNRIFNRQSFKASLTDVEKSITQTA